MLDLFAEMMRSPETALAGVPGGLALLAVFVASLGGSVHCAAMCGAFPVLLRAASSGEGSRRLWRGPVPLYHLGRLGAYAALGALSGAYGRVALGSGTAGGVALAAAAALGLALALNGLALFRGAASAGEVRRPGRTGFAIARAAQRLGAGALRVARAQPSGAALVGAASVLLPCGWLYGFVLAAAATGGAAYGAVVMAVFWLGTIPALSALPAAFGSVTRHRAGLRRMAGVLLIAAGVATIGMRIAPVLSHGTTDAAAEASCH